VSTTFFAALTALFWASASSPGATPSDRSPGFPQYPALSGSGDFVVYADRGDLWSVPTTGGVANRLTSHGASEGRSAFSPDDRQLAFESDRDGTRNLYVMDVAVQDGRLVASGRVQRVTTSDRWEALSGFSPSGDALLFHSYREPEIYRAPRMYSAPIDGGPVQRLTGAFGRAPRLSSDEQTLVFSRGYAPWERPAYRGSGNRDVWSLDLASGEFTRRTNSKSNEGEAFIRPDGSLVLRSSRDGQNDIWTIGANTPFEQAVNRTHLSRGEHATIGHGVRDLTVSADGSTAVVGVWDGLQRLDLRNPSATLQAIDIQVGGDVSTLDRRIERLDKKVGEVAMHPSGEAIATVARGEVLVRSVQEDHPTRRVTQDHARQRHIAWSPDGQTLYFTSDASGSDAIWQATVSLRRDDLLPEPEEESVAIEDADDDAEEVDDKAEEDESDEATADDEDESDEATADDEDESDEATADDEDSDAADDKDDQDDAKNTTGEAWADALRFDVQELIPGPAVSRPMPSPDGRSLLYQRGNGDLVLRDLDSGDDRVLLESWDAPEVRWASDGQHIVYSVSDLDFNNDIWLMAVDSPEDAVNLTQHPDIDRAPRLSADGKVLVFLSDRNRIGENWDYDVWMIPLDEALEDMTDYELDAHVKDAAKAAGKRKILPLAASENASDSKDAADPIEFTKLDTAWKRARRLTSHNGSEDDLYLSPGGDAIVYSGTVGDDEGLWSVDHRGKNREKITAGAVSNVRGDLGGKTISFVAGGTAKHAPAKGGKTESWPIDADARITVADEQRQKFQETARTFGDTFYHPTMKGLDWEAIARRYGDLAARTRTSQAFNRVVDHLFGEVNGSHTGIGGGFGYDGPDAGIGHLGIEVKPVEDGYRVVRVLPDGPADRGEAGLRSGDVIVSINDTPLSQDGVVTDLRAAMEDTAGEEILVDVRSEDGTERTTLLVPMSFGRWGSLARDDELASRREAVDAASDGRLGYLHIRGMNMPSVHQFEHDLYAAAHDKDGLIIDVRDNSGGFTTDILLSSLTAPAHAFTVPRGAKVGDVRPDSYPRDRRLLYGYSRPIVVLCNENSFSNAEIFSHAIQTTGRGTLVGEETFGGVISTGSFKLIDGTRVRQPFRGWYLPDGTDMESRGAIPDVRVVRHPQDEVAGHDAQLDAAVRALLTQLPATPPSVHPRPAS
jgi:tricorn protease